MDRGLRMQSQVAAEQARGAFARCPQAGTEQPKDGVDAEAEESITAAATTTRSAFKIEDPSPGPREGRF